MLIVISYIFLGVIVRSKTIAIRAVQYCCMLMQPSKRKNLQVLVKLMVKLAHNKVLVLSDTLPTQELVSVSDKLDNVLYSYFAFYPGVSDFPTLSYFSLSSLLADAVLEELVIWMS